MPELRLDVPRTATIGGRARFVLQLGNTARTTETLYLRGRTPTVDFVVLDASGRTVWRRLHGEVIPAIIQLVTLAPGEQRTFTHEWALHDQRRRALPPGRYTVTGQWLTDGEPLESQPGTLVIRR